MEEKTKKQLEALRSYVHSLRDIRTLGILVFVVVLLVMTWSGIKVVDTNYGLQKQINEMQQKTDVAKLQNETLKLRNEYYATKTYEELSARQNFGLALPGETEVLVPKEVALAKITPVQETDAAVKDTGDTPFYKKNFRDWMTFFLHRENLQQ